MRQRNSEPDDAAAVAGRYFPGGPCVRRDPPVMTRPAGISSSCRLSSSSTTATTGYVHVEGARTHKKLCSVNTCVCNHSMFLFINL
jgi:hypothetical protein